MRKQLCWFEIHFKIANKILYKRKNYSLPRIGEIVKFDKGAFYKIEKIIRRYDEDNRDLKLDYNLERVDIQLGSVK